MEEAKTVLNSKQDIFKILEPFWASGCRRSYCFLQGRVIFRQYMPKKHVLVAKFTNHVTRLDTRTIWVYSYLDGDEEIPYRDSRFILVNDIIGTMTQVGSLEWQPTNVGLSRSAKVTQPKWPCVLQSGVKKVFSEVWRKWNMFVIRWCFWRYHAKARLQTSWAWIFLFKHETRNRHISKINWKLYVFISFIHVSTKHFYCIFKLKYLWFIPNTMQIISSFHHL